MSNSPLLAPTCYAHSKTGTNTRPQYENSYVSHLDALEELDNHSWDDNMLWHPEIHCESCQAVLSGEVVSQSLQTLILPQLHGSTQSFQC